MVNNDTSSSAYGSNTISATILASSSQMVQISQAYFDHLLRLLSSSTGFQATHTSSLIMNAYITSSIHP